MIECYGIVSIVGDFEGIRSEPIFFNTETLAVMDCNMETIGTGQSKDGVLEIKLF